MDVNKSKSNNKKRSLEISTSTLLCNFNENGIEKTFNDKYNEFINKDYDSFKMAEIKKYAEELGISNKGKKYEIHERIEQHLQSQISIIKEIRESEEINPFNKGVIQLLIKEIDETERLFWLIFRNKTIFKEIFSKFKYNRSYTYERLYDIDYILSSFPNGIEILKDKIKCNSHLNISFEEISRIIKKDTTENRELINQIFQKYSKSIDIEHIVGRSIENQNLFLLKYLKVNGEMLNSSNFTIFIRNYRSLKIINYLNEFGIRNLLLKGYLFSGNVSFFSTFKLKHLIYFIDKLPIFVKLNEDDLNLYKNLKSSISKLNISFTNEQLHSTIFQLLCHHSEIFIKDENTANNIDKDIIKTLKSNISKYVDVLYHIFFSESEKIIYCLLFKDINQIKSTMNPDKIDVFYFFQFFKLKTNMHYDLFKYRNWGSGQKQRYFLRMVTGSDDLELIQLAFEKYGDYFKNFKIKSSILDSVIIQSIEFLNFIFDNYQDSTDIFQDNNDNHLLVTNLPTLLHYEKLMIKLGRKFKFDNLFYPFTKGLGKDQFIIRKLLNPDAYRVPQNENFDISEFMALVPNFKIEYPFISYLKTRYNNSIKINHIGNKNTLNSFLENHFKSTITTIDLNQIFDCESSIYKIKFYKYSHQKKKDTKDFKNNGKFLIEINIENLFHFLYINGRYEEIININKSNDWIFGSFTYSFENLVLSKEYIDLLFSHGFKDGKIVNKNFQPQEIIQWVIKKNHLSIFKLLSLKYKFLFNQKSKSNPDALFYPTQLKDFLVNSINRNNVEMVEMLLNYITFTKNEYQSLKSKNPKLFENIYDK